MALTGEEIRARLSAFAARWSVYEGSERAEAQTFLNLARRGLPRRSCLGCIAGRSSNRRLLELNRAIAAGEIDYRPFA